MGKGKAIDDRTRRMIFAMIKAGASTSAIVAKTGVSKSTINNLKAKYTSGEDEGSVIDQTSDQTSDQTTKLPTRSRTRATKREQVKPGQTDEAFAGLCKLIDPLLDGMALTRAIKDGKDRAIAETKYAEALIKVYSKLGSWQGLDNPEPPPATTSPLEKFGEAMKMYMEGEDESK